MDQLKIESQQIVSQEAINREIEANRNDRVQALLNHGLSITEVISFLRAEYSSKGYKLTSNKPSLSQSLKSPTYTQVIVDSFR